MGEKAEKRGSGEVGKRHTSEILLADERGVSTIASPPPRFPASRLTCNRCGFPVVDRVRGCKNPCRNCGTIYPLGDCSD